MTSYLLTRCLYQKMSRYNVFQYGTPDRMSYLRTLYDHFENFRKIKFQWGRNFEKPLAFCEFLLDFQSENDLELTKDRRIKMRRSFWSRTYFCFFFHCLTPPPYFYKNIYSKLLYVHIRRLKNVQK